MCMKMLEFGFLCLSPMGEGDRGLEPGVGCGCEMLCSWVRQESSLLCLPKEGSALSPEVAGGAGNSSPVFPSCCAYSIMCRKRIVRPPPDLAKATE